MHQLCSVFCQYPSAEIIGYEVFPHPYWELKKFFWNIFQIFCIVLMKDKPSDIKIEKYDGKKISLMYCFNFFRNQLWQDLVSYNSFRNMNMFLLKVAMCEKCRSSDFQSAKARRQNLKKLLPADPELWGYAILGSKITHFPKWKFFSENLFMNFVSLIHAYLHAKN